MKWLRLLGLLLLSFSPALAAPGGLHVGSKPFTESYVLGEILRQVALTAHEGEPTHTKGLGHTGIVVAALENASIDIYAEYTGTINEEVLKNKGPVDLSSMSRQLARMGLGIGVPLGFNDTYALAMRESDAVHLGIRTISDLVKHPDLKLGLDHEFLKRVDGWPGLKKAYSLPFADPQGLDHGLVYDAMARGQIDVTDIYSTDAKIPRYHLRVLEDDRKFFPAYDAVLFYRLDMPRRLPHTWAVLQSLNGRISAAEMIRMNTAVEVDHLTWDKAAAQFLAHGFKANRPAVRHVQRSRFLSLLTGPDFWTLTIQHLKLVFVSLFLGIVTGVPLGIIAARVRAVAQAILSIVGIIQTIPSLALLMFLILAMGRVGPVPAIIALFLYSLLPIVRNTYTGLTDIPSSLRESASALGLPSGSRLRLVELPLASRSILAGIKTSAVINVGTATIAAFIGAGGYGERILSGYGLADNDTMLSGAVPAAVLALLVQGLFDLLDRWLIPAGLRLKR
ncbi:MAG: ABC transporter permease subunit [Armatimonadota bacterium]|nr:ABC transporter permease subunit [Armatimonadota bacterium]